MLDFFLVLGQIPGTNISLNFIETLLLVTIAVAAGVAWFRGNEPQKPFLTVWASLASFENAHFSLPVEWTRRKAAALPANSCVAWLNRHWRITR